MAETFHEWAYRINKELEQAYVDNTKANNLKEAYKVACRGREIAKKIAEDPTEAKFMQDIYSKKMAVWDERVRLSTCQSSVSTTPCESSAPSFAPAKKSDVRLDDIAGLEEVKTLIRNKVILPIKYPEIEMRYKKNAKRTHGLLFYGPPGTGKSMFCAGIAGELDMSEHRAKASDIIRPELGASLSNLERFFDSIRQDSSPRILARLDEIDALAASRGKGAQGADAEMSRLVSVFLQGLDDLMKENRDKCILFIGSTNLPWEIEPAILRGQRIDEQIYIGLPDFSARRFLVERDLGGSVPPKEDGLDLDKLARDLKGYSAGDIVTVCEKIAEVPYVRHCKTNTPTVLTQADIDSVIKNHPTSVPYEVMKPYYEYNQKRGYKTPIID